uniref:Uncharacterized protein n=1 Tax=Arundo donax TaxID=35708 RepID=A0A0A9GYY3_ARUDO
MFLSRKTEGKMNIPIDIKITLVQTVVLLAPNCCHPCNKLIAPRACGGSGPDGRDVLPERPQRRGPRQG